MESEIFYNSFASTQNILEVMNEYKKNFTRNDSETVSTAREVYYILNGHIAPTICAIGILGNIINMIIFGRFLRAARSAIYSCLFVISLADFFSVVVYLVYSITCIHTSAGPLLSQRDIPIDLAGTFSHFTFFIWTIPINVFMAISNWCTVMLMAVRFIAVYFPLKASEWCSPSRTKKVLCCICLLAILCAIPECYTREVIYVKHIGVAIKFTDLQHNTAFRNAYYLVYYEVINWLIPFFVNLILSGLLINTLRRSNSLFRSDSHVTPQRQRDQRKVSIMLLVVVFFFIICSSPSLVWRSLENAAQMTNIDLGSWILLRGISDIMLIINCSGNIVLYLFTNENYRKNIKEIACCKFSRRATYNSSSVTTNIGNQTSNRGSSRYQACSINTNGIQQPTTSTTYQKDLHTVITSCGKSNTPGLLSPALPLLPRETVVETSTSVDDNYSEPKVSPEFL